ncbi:hypothetical protein MYMAC_000528 [Corallococcus macrosporus DSM 14697]|uniref:Uncharacterized protein n=1 Tax=Corallococcus macrosporus DSM 14697 TaxID=1189310 RepID=A0A250JM54_9BACT|nr:hypothetical protein MYMAC_000528 [Corallococcus macrosporus DSM 14697]
MPLLGRDVRHGGLRVRLLANPRGSCARCEGVHAMETMATALRRYFDESGCRLQARPPPLPAPQHRGSQARGALPRAAPRPHRLSHRPHGGIRGLRVGDRRGLRRLPRGCAAMGRVARSCTGDSNSVSSTTGKSSAPLPGGDHLGWFHRGGFPLSRSFLLAIYTLIGTRPKGVPLKPQRTRPGHAHRARSSSGSSSREGRGQPTERVNGTHRQCRLLPWSLREWPSRASTRAASASGHG